MQVKTAVKYRMERSTCICTAINKSESPAPVSLTAYFMHLALPLSDPPPGAAGREGRETQKSFLPPFSVCDRCFVQNANLWEILSLPVRVLYYDSPPSSLPSPAPLREGGASLAYAHKNALVGALLSLYVCLSLFCRFDNASLILRPFGL